MEVQGYTADGRIRMILDGRELTVPDDPSNRHRKMIAAWVRAGNVIPAHTPPPVSPQQVRVEASRRMRALVADYSPEERETWATQAEEAHSLVADPAAETPLLDILASARGISRAAMAQRILQRRRALAFAIGWILANQERILSMESVPADFDDDAQWS